MSLQNLPNELIDKVLSQLTGHLDRGTLTRLALTCRALSILVRPFLYEHLDIALTASPYTPKTSLRWMYLHRTLKGQPAIGGIVRSLKIHTGPKSLYSPSFLNIGPSPLEAMFFLGGFLNLCELWTTLPIFMGPPIQTLPFRGSLIQLYLHSDKVTSLQILRLKELPKLRLLKFTFLQLVEYEADIHSTGANKVLWSLDFGDLAPVCCRALKTILSHCTNLRVLKCCVPILTKEHDAKPWKIYLTAFYKMSPSKILHTLMPVSATLTNLHLYGHNQKFCSHDGSRLDLSMFTSLKELAIFSLFLLPPGKKHSLRDGLYELLPETINNLRLLFTPKQSLMFYDTAGEANESMHALYWMNELAIYKSTCFPTLEIITLDEVIPFSLETSVAGRNEPDTEMLDPPQILQRSMSTCKEANISLVFNIRLDQELYEDESESSEGEF